MSFRFFILGFVVIGLMGCATNAPQPIKEAQEVTTVGVATAKQNTFLIVDLYNAEIKKVVSEAYSSVIEERAKSLVNEQGEIDKEAFKEFTAVIAEEVKTRHNYYDAKAEDIKEKIGSQFDSIIAISAVVNSFNNAEEIPDDVIQNFFRSSTELGIDIASITRQEEENEDSFIRGLLPDKEEVGEVIRSQIVEIDWSSLAERVREYTNE